MFIKVNYEFSESYHGSVSYKLRILSMPNIQIQEWEQCHLYWRISSHMSVKSTEIINHGIPNVTYKGINGDSGHCWPILHFTYRRAVWRRCCGCSEGLSLICASACLYHYLLPWAQLCLYRLQLTRCQLYLHKTIEQQSVKMEENLLYRQSDNLS